ncbi:MAG: phosphoribosylformylglycinamidine synthase [Oscillospiraceae bacterium]|jgi:phosphoribosylformylglycinamidine synthase|nr:phosphoribosylformylglycinamidine synthase [Oscillospiraceae bacterium]
MVYRYFTEKREQFDVEARSLLAESRDFLGIATLSAVRVFNRYDIEGADDDSIGGIASKVLSEPAIDLLYPEILPELDAPFVLAVESLPGQYDQRADSCAQCAEMITRGTRPTVRCAVVYAFYGELTESDRDALRRLLINPVESREASHDKPETLRESYPEPPETPILHDFRTASGDALTDYLREYALAMDIDDLRCLQQYFRDEEHRDPTETELRLVDTYWSDHCRHTTFLTSLDDIGVHGAAQSGYSLYLDLRREVYGDAADTRPVTLMDVATIAAKALKKRGLLANLDVSDEINACSIVVDVDNDGATEKWLLMFKNETHNHPTEIEPFGGAATCIGGAIRDPLSGRAYVYQAMRVTGSADPRAAVGDTLTGKLPQRRITTSAAHGYSSYGNQIGLATGLVHEFYHPKYAAKRMEIGAVVGAVPLANVRRETPTPGDVVILLGGRTGRDGIGGATGSSKSHTRESVVTMASEVQKGNAPEERKIQRLFRDAQVTRMIKRCNDFGAGGVSVAIGELADGLEIDLSKVRKKYDGLGATELAISESQERMAVVVAASDADAFIEKAAGENLEAYVVARVTAEPRMVLKYGGATVANLSRAFLNSNGAVKHAHAEIYESPEPLIAKLPINPIERLRNTASDLQFASQRGMAELFDSSVGASAVLAPYGGRTQRTPTQVMASLLPVPNGKTTTASVMAFGFDPFLSDRDTYAGAKFAVITSIAKLVAAGVDPDAVYLTFQEYFEKLRDDPTRWGKPLSALLGALEAQIGLETAAIGGKDSMSGSFLELDVPPTLVSFAVAPADARTIISPEFKAPDHTLALFTPRGTLPETKQQWREIHALVKSGAIVAAWAIDAGGVAEAVTKMSFGNNIGAEIDADTLAIAPHSFAGGILAELASPVGGAHIVGRTIAEPVIRIGGESVAIAELLTLSESTLESVFPTRAEHTGDAPSIAANKRHTIVAGHKFAAPRATVLSFLGTNSEIDTAAALTRAGANADVLVVRNLTPDALRDSITRAADAIRNSQIVVLPGGFSGGDEPDGSAKFITAFFRAREVSDAVNGLLNVGDGLMLGICNGFQALIKLGLVPYGWIAEPDENAPTLTHNIIGRHMARYAYTRVASVASPWMSRANVGDVFAVPLSHGEGRFVAPDDALKMIISGGGIATQYCDIGGTVSMDISVNPNGSMAAVEGLYSPDGRVFGKMGHIERRGDLVGRNIEGERHMPVFESGVYYFS